MIYFVKQTELGPMIVDMLPLEENEESVKLQFIEPFSINIQWVKRKDNGHVVIHDNWEDAHAELMTRMTKLIKECEVAIKRETFKRNRFRVLQERMRKMKKHQKISYEIEAVR